MISFSIVIATYGDDYWKELAWERAYPCAIEQGADEVIQEHLEDATISEARNELASRAKSDWLIFLDADDELSEGYVDAMRVQAENCGGNQWLLNPRVSYVRNGRPRPAAYLEQTNLQDDNYLIVGTGIKRDLFALVGGFGEYPHGFEDWSLWAKAWRAGAKIVKVPGATYIAHVNPNSKHRLAWKDREWQVEMHHRVRRELFPELYE